jgi:diguanylate cyclase (GGDEF)-like protein
LLQEIFEGKKWPTFILFALAVACLAWCVLFVWKENKKARSERAKENAAHAQQLQQLRDMFHSLSCARNREQLLERILEYLKNTIPNSACAVYFITNDQNRILNLNRLTCYEPKNLPVPDRVAVIDVVNQKIPFTTCLENGLRTRLLSTLSGRLQSVGAVDLYKPEGFSPDEFELFQSLIDYASTLWALYESLATWEEEAFIDPLTGLGNRRYIMRRLQEENERIKRYGGNACLAMGDMGNLKHVNDDYGHTKGDEVLARAAATIQKSLRVTDVVGRYGGDEFVLLLPNIIKSDANMVVDRVNAALKNLRIQSDDADPESPPIEVVMDFGIALFPGDAPTLMDIINQADEVMYANKTARKEEMEEKYCAQH